MGRTAVRRKFSHLPVMCERSLRQDHPDGGFGLSCVRVSLTNMSELPEIPPGPADVDYPRRALSRIALSHAARDAAETAAALVPTVSDGHAHTDDAEEVRLAHQLTVQARAVLERAVVHARERGVSWQTIGEDHHDITRQSAHERHGDAIGAWEDALDRPWTHSGPWLASRLPDGADRPAETAASLDRWCATGHASDSARGLAADKGVAEHMVSANLPGHTDLTRLNSVLRHGNHLAERDDVTQAEWDAQQTRKTALTTDIEQEHR